MTINKAKLVGRLGPLGRLVWLTYDALSRLRFHGSGDYWERRYASGRNSGVGSYGRLAEFKAEFLNEYVLRNSVESVVEFGCGDGNQLGLAQYPAYIGVDVSRTVIELCKRSFKSDTTKLFITLGELPATDVASDLALSLDVIYHLVEDTVFEAHMRALFQNARRAVIIYASNETRPAFGAHVRHRKFTDWVEQNTDWKLASTMKNKYPYDPRNPSETSWADFFVFEPVS